METPLAVNHRNDRLIRIDAASEERLHDGTYDPLPLALVVVVREGRLLLVYNRARAGWELPGGMIDPGERPRDAAVRELAEETGQQATAVRCVGAATYWLGADDRLEHGGIFVANIGPEQPFTPTDEIEGILWWDRNSPIEDIGRADPLDLAVADFAIGQSRARPRR